MTEKNNNQEKSFFTISEISTQLDLPSHVLRFWERQFIQIKPTRHNSRRYYTAKNVEIIKTIKNLLYCQGYTIEGAKKELSSKKNNETLDSNITKKELLKIRENLLQISTKLSNTIK